MRKIKKCVALMLVALMTLSLYVTGYAADENKSEEDKKEFTVYSSEFPDAYIITELLNEDNIENRNGEKNLVTIKATVFVEENYAYINDELIISDSRLLSKDEVEAIGIDNFDDLNPDSNVTTQGRSTNSRGKLSITFSGTYSMVGSGVSVNLNGYANWNGFDTIYTPANNPAVGNDFLGIAWSGGYQVSSSNCYARWNVGGAQNVYLSDAVPNAGRVYAFDEFANAGGKYMIYVSQADISATLTKNSLTGGANKAEAIMKYIHTYQSGIGNINISASISSVGLGFSLSNTPKQWSLSCTLGGLPY